MGNTGRDAGSYEEDAVQTGMTGFFSEPTGHPGEQLPGAISPYGNVSMQSSGYRDSFIIYMQEIGVITDHKSFTINQRFSDKTRPENVSVPVALYLGSHA